MANSSFKNDSMVLDDMADLMYPPGKDVLKPRSFKKRRRRNRSNLFYLLESAGKISEESDTTDEALRDYMENIAAQSDSDLESNMTKRLTSLRCQLNNLTHGCADPYQYADKAESDSCSEINYQKKRRKRKRKHKKICGGSTHPLSVTLQPSLFKVPPPLVMDATHPTQMSNSKNVILKAHRSRLNDDDFLADAENGHTSSCGEFPSHMSCGVTGSGERVRRHTWSNAQDMDVCNDEQDSESETMCEPDTPESSALSSSSEDGLFTNDEGQFGDDEQEESCYETDSQCTWLRGRPMSDDEDKKFHKLYWETLEYLKSKPFFLEEDQVSRSRQSGSSFLRSEMGQSAMLEANKRIKKFLQDPTKMELRLAHVKRKDKEELSQLAALYSLHCKMEDSPKRGMVVLVKTRSTSKPEQSALCHFLGRPFRELRESQTCSPAIDVKRRRKTSPALMQGLVVDTAPPLSQRNIGNLMLQNMGWAPGQGLGPSCSGIREPVKAFKRPGRLGLGHLGKSQSQQPG